WKHGDVETWRCGNMEMWKHGAVETWSRGNMEPWKHGAVETWMYQSSMILISMVIKLTNEF
ncbi:hypothetical protein, partial [Shewanella sp. GutDb-MelDb]|uniref:hypothetical protein n=1 Tax=Shewanella sp. GutDb-MelDb TaxID=2058316 RepID=UPI001C6092E2